MDLDHDHNHHEALEEKPSFFQEMRQEIKKISWPSKQEVVQSTKVVIFSTFFLGFSVYLVDLFVKGVLDSTARIVKMLFQW